MKVIGGREQSFRVQLDLLGKVPLEMSEGEQFLGATKRRKVTKRMKKI